MKHLLKRMRRMKKLLYTLTALLMAGSAYADVVQDGEEVGFIYGVPSCDHFFTRNDYTDSGLSVTYDDVVSFKNGNTQLVWIYLDDDAIYENEEIQALTPSDYALGKPYNEITYNSFQTKIYLPVGIEIVSNGDVEWQRGDRMPNSTQIQYYQRGTTTIDGVNYKIYIMLCYNMMGHGIGTHFSSRTAQQYETYGALRKDYRLFGLYLKNTANQPQGRLSDMIIAQTIFAFKETTQVFFYGTGGNGVENRFMRFHRVALYGSEGIPEIILAASIALNTNSAWLTAGESMPLTATVLPSNATNTAVTWATSDSTIATVDSNGLVTAQSAGIATVTASTIDGSNLSASCLVSVYTMRGDVNDDGIVGMDDLTDLINYLLTDNAQGLCLNNADCDLSGNVNMDDLTELINYLLTNHWPPDSELSN